MKQLAVQNGDLVLGPGGFVMVTGQAKVRQDLALALQEPVETDRFHPGWGSLLPGMIGQVANPAAQDAIETEVYRVIRNYIIGQVSLMQQHVQTGRKPQFSSNEIIRGVESIQIRQSGDRYFVRIALRTLADELLTITTSVES